MFKSFVFFIFMKYEKSDVSLLIICFYIEVFCVDFDFEVGGILLCIDKNGMVS